MIRAVLFTCAAWMLPAQTLAHAFGSQYTLPLPVSFYATGGVLAFLISVLFLSFLGSRDARAPSKTLSFSPWCGRYLSLFLRGFFLFVLLLGVSAGIFGEQSTYGNLLPVLFWIGLVLAIPYLSIIIGELWKVANPFRTIVSLFTPEKTDSTWRYGYLPALIGYILLIVLELFLTNISAVPLILAEILILYTLMLAAGSFVYGRATWFRFADLFSLFFRLASMLSPLSLSRRGVALRSPAKHLALRKTKYLTLSTFVIFGLAATAYDGFRESALMAEFATRAMPFLDPLAFHVMIFFLFSFGFFALFAAAQYSMKKIVRGTRPLSWYLKRFTFSLVPILLAYHFAHYFPLLITTGALAVPMFSDPFNLGWNLLGTAHLDTAVLLSAEIVWYVQLATIVLGHIFAAYVAHLVSLMEFKSRKHAILSQIPLTLLMVFFTAFGLWILGQPFALA